MTADEARQQIIAGATVKIRAAAEEAIKRVVDQINGDYINSFPMELEAFLALRKELEPGVTGPIDSFEVQQRIALLYDEWTALERHLSGTSMH